jgi:hypothetical protein
MVDSFNIPKRMTKPQLEWWILFGICVAGKGAKQTQAKVEALLEDMRPLCSLRCQRSKPMPAGPFACVAAAMHFGNLGTFLRKHRLGQYTRIEKAFRAAVKLDLGNISIEALETVPGLGPKTARMIAMYGLSNSEVAVLDTHILKFLRSLGYKAPKSTPSGRKYAELERIFLEEVKKRNISPADLDTEIWKFYAENPKREKIWAVAGS